MLLIFALLRVEHEAVGSVVSGAHLEESAHFEVEDLLDCQIHPLSEHSSGIIDFFAVKLDFDLFLQVYGFELLDAAHQYIVPVDLDRLTPVLPVHPQLLHLESQPGHLLLEVTAHHRLRWHISDWRRKNPKRLRDSLKISLFSVCRHLDINCAAKILRTLPVIFLKQTHLINLKFGRAVVPTSFGSSFKDHIFFQLT